MAGVGFLCISNEVGISSCRVRIGNVSSTVIWTSVLKTHSGKTSVIGTRQTTCSASFSFWSLSGWLTESQVIPYSTWGTYCAVKVSRTRFKANAILNNNTSHYVRVHHSESDHIRLQRKTHSTCHHYAISFSLRLLDRWHCSVLLGCLYWKLLIAFKNKYPTHPPDQTSLKTVDYSTNSSPQFSCIRVKFAQSLLPGSNWWLSEEGFYELPIGCCIFNEQRLLLSTTVSSRTSTIKASLII